MSYLFQIFSLHTFLVTSGSEEGCFVVNAVELLVILVTLFSFSKAFFSLFF